MTLCKESTRCFADVCFRGAGFEPEVVLIGLISWSDTFSTIGVTITFTVDIAGPQMTHPFVFHHPGPLSSAAKRFQITPWNLLSHIHGSQGMNLSEFCSSSFPLKDLKVVSLARRYCVSHCSGSSTMKIAEHIHGPQKKGGGHF